MTNVTPLRAPQHVLQLLSRLHKLSLEQEAAISSDGKIISSKVLGDLEDESYGGKPSEEFDALMLDKFIALDEDKCHFVYQLIASTGAVNVIEAGTSFGVSTIYMALAIAQNKAATGRAGKVIATEKEPQKATVARAHWEECGSIVEDHIELRVGDLLDTLQAEIPDNVDLLLLDIWCALALPTLKLVQPHLRYGAVILADNTISGADGYKDLLEYLRAPDGDFQNITLPYTNGFEMSVYMPTGLRR